MKIGFLIRLILWISYFVSFCRYSYNHFVNHIEPTNFSIVLMIFLSTLIIVDFISEK